jgi:hypothetical protein
VKFRGKFGELNRPGCLPAREGEGRKLEEQKVTVGCSWARLKTLSFNQSTACESAAENKKKSEDSYTSQNFTPISWHPFRFAASAESAAIQQCFSLTINQRIVLSTTIN